MNYTKLKEGRYYWWQKSKDHPKELCLIRENRHDSTTLEAAFIDRVRIPLHTPHGIFTEAKVE